MVRIEIFFRRASWRFLQPVRAGPALVHPVLMHLDGVRRGIYHPAPQKIGENMGAATIHNDWDPQPRLADRPSYDTIRFEKNSRGRKLWQRERRVVDRFLSTLRPGSTVLDVPSGMGRFTDLIDRNGHRAVSIDLLFEHVHYIANRQNRTSTSALQADIGRLPLADNSIDAALCIRLLHHLTPAQITTALAELHRVTCSALFTFYSRRTFKFMKKRLRGRPLNGRYYSPLTIEQLCRDAGWSGRSALTSNPLHNLHFATVSRVELSMDRVA